MRMKEGAGYSEAESPATAQAHSWHELHAKWWKRRLVAVLFLACGGCAAQESERTGVGITGIDHLADHLSVQQFSVDGYNAAQAGKGGSTVCCALLPNRWQPGMEVEVVWNVTNWRDCTGEEHRARVPVEPYTSLGTLWVHFLRDGSVRVVVSDPGPRNPAYPGPREPIPQKYPWREYPLDETCKWREKEAVQP